jgi:octaprenyl-diphosphate synthase
MEHQAHSNPKTERKLKLSHIKAPIKEEMGVFESKFHHAMQTSVPLLDRIMTYVVKHKGKQMRPMFVLLSAGVCGGISDKTYRGAILAELLHTATLIHDDVVDDAYERRGFFSINALWKNKVAVLVGDYLLSRGLLLSVQNGDYGQLRLLSSAVEQMSEGELLQIEKTRRLNTNEDVYFDIIEKKTASLIAACCSIGAASTQTSEAKVEIMRLFGEKVGIAFQIKDDLFDYGRGPTGKPRGIDIQEKKLTLPLIYALQQAESGQRRRIVRLVKHFSNKEGEMDELLTFVTQHGGLDYATEKMHQYQSEALDLLDNFPDSAYRQSLGDLVRYTTQRVK